MKTTHEEFCARQDGLACSCDNPEYLTVTVRVVLKRTKDQRNAFESFYGTEEMKAEDVAQFTHYNGLIALEDEGYATVLDIEGSEER